MDNGEFQKEVLERLSNLETELAFIKGIIEGRDWKSNRLGGSVSIIIAVLSLGISAILVLTRVF